MSTNVDTRPSISQLTVASPSSYRSTRFGKPERFRPRHLLLHLTIGHVIALCALTVALVVTGDGEWRHISLIMKTRFRGPEKANKPSKTFVT